MNGRMRSLTAAVLVLVLMPAPARSARAAEAPLGKTNFAIALGGLRASSRENWVQLGQYTFADDGTVSETYWSWSQTARVVRASTGNPAEGCSLRDCTVLTAAGWQSTDAADEMTGAYRVRGHELHITWDDGHWEEWTLSSQAHGALANAELAANDFGATHGFGGGSNVPWTTRIPARRIAAADHTRFVHRYYLWKTEGNSKTGFTGYIDHGDGSPFWATHWNLCADHRCLGSSTLQEGTLHTAYYIAPADTSSHHRRDTLWHWHTDLADGRHEYCYTGNSHVKPMIQVIDDKGRFHGWVGAEASLNQTTRDGPNADDLGIFRILT